MKGAAQPDNWPGFERRADEEAIEPTDPPRSGFRLGPPEEQEPPPLPLGQEVNLGPGPGAKKPYHAPRPWYLSWLVSKNPPGFQWKERGD